MRHFGSLLLAAVFGPALFLLTGTGLSAFGSARSGTFIDDPLSTLAALGALLLGGILYGILVMVRLSPIGPGLAGLGLMGTSGWALIAPQSYDDTFSQLDVHMGGAVGQWGLGILLGVPLLATLTSPRRWRQTPYPVSAPPLQYYYPQQPGQPQAPQPQQQYRPSIPDPTKQMPVQPAYLTLPDIAAPSLGYPAVSTPVQEPAKKPVVVPKEEAPPLPKRVPAPPPPEPQETKSQDDEPTKPLS